MGFLDALLGGRGKKVKGAAPDRLFAMTTANVTFETGLGLKPKGTAGLVFQPLGTADFEGIMSETEELLRGTAEETGTELHSHEDEYGYRWQVFRDMMLPLMRPAIAVAGTFCFLEVWNEFTLALILTGTRTKTVPIGMSQFLTEHSVEWGPMAAAALMLLLPLLAVTFFLQRSLVRGLTLGAVR